MRKLSGSVIESGVRTTKSYRETLKCYVKKKKMDMSPITDDRRKNS